MHSNGAKDFIKYAAHDVPAIVFHFKFSCRIRRYFISVVHAYFYNGLTMSIIIILSIIRQLLYYNRLSNICCMCMYVCMYVCMYICMYMSSL